MPIDILSAFSTEPPDLQFVLPRLLKPNSRVSSRNSSQRKPAFNICSYSVGNTST